MGQKWEFPSPPGAKGDLYRVHESSFKTRTTHSRTIEVEYMSISATATISESNSGTVVIRFAKNNLDNDDPTAIVLRLETYNQLCFVLNMLNEEIAGKDETKT